MRLKGIENLSKSRGVSAEQLGYHRPKTPPLRDAHPSGLGGGGVHTQATVFLLEDLMETINVSQRLKQATVTLAA